MDHKGTDGRRKVRLARLQEFSTRNPWTRNGFAKKQFRAHA
jgi:hypothetical protein